MGLYQENIIDLYKNPLNKGSIDNPDSRHRSYNPLCGDDITIDIKVKGNTIIDIKHCGEGCAISQAAVSLLTEECKSLSLQEIKTITPGDVVEMLGIEIGPVRLKCALLGLEAIHEVIDRYEGNNKQ